MVFAIEPTLSPDGRGGSAPDARARAFAAARRHSVQVRWLRRLLMASAIGGSALVIALPLLRPLATAPEGAGVGEAGLDGTRVTMQAPRLSGFRADGRPYEIQATSGQQNIKSPNIIDLDKIDAKLGLPESGSIHIVAAQGVYDSTRNFMTVPSAVRITGDSGYDVALKSADMDFAAGTVVSADPVTMQMKGGAISADRLDISNSGQRIGFAGDVHSTFFAQGADAGNSTAAPEPVPAATATPSPVATPPASTQMSTTP